MLMIGERLRAVREEKKMSQGHVEKATGLLRCYVSRVENGHTVPSIETLGKWSKALGVSMSQLFADDGQDARLLPALKNNHVPKLNRIAANHLRRVETAFARMNSRDIVIVTHLARKFAER
jgi:transcriptional regulator with XRE-family HTH domain